jgi:hypothetical protein
MKQATDADAVGEVGLVYEEVTLNVKRKRLGTSTTLTLV